MATPTQPKTQMKRVATSASLVPPTIPWAMIQSQAEEPERAEREAQGRRWQPARVRGLRALGPDVADEHEDERQGDRRRGAREVDRERQPARVRRVERVRQDDRGGPSRAIAPTTERPAASRPTRPPLTRRWRVGCDATTGPPATTRTIASAATIGRITSPSVEPAGSVGPGEADGLAAGVGVGSGVALGVGSALADEAGVGAGVGDGVGARCDRERPRVVLGVAVGALRPPAHLVHAGRELRHRVDDQARVGRRDRCDRRPAARRRHCAARTSIRRSPTAR